ncbi:MAG: ATP-dependent metallopeptidase FtsH/Yme1/Tma family protein, partial [Pseudanabaena sp.]
MANFWRRVKTTVVSLAILQSVTTTLPVSAQTDTESVVTISYTELLANVKENRVQKIDLESNGLAAEAVLKDGGRRVRVDLIARDGNTELMKALRENGVDTAVKAPQQPTLIWQLVSTFFVPMLLIFILLMVLR